MVPLMHGLFFFGGLLGLVVGVMSFPEGEVVRGCLVVEDERSILAFGRLGLRAVSPEAWFGMLC